MGWTEYCANCYKNGRVDVKRECDEKIIDTRYFEIVKSVLKGATWYGAVKEKKTGRVMGVVIKTSVKNNSYYNFAYKIIEETAGPYDYDCPKSIIALLSETDNEWAIAWRKKCLEKKRKNLLNDLPIGTTIKWVDSNGKEHTYYKHKAAYQFKRPFWMNKYDWNYISRKHIPENFEIVTE